jgi:predicted transcriptional regulator
VNWRETALSKNQKRWTKEEDTFLIEHYGAMTLQKMGEHLHRSKESVNKRLTRLNLRASNTVLRKKWTPEQDAFLQRNIDSMNNREIANSLGRSPSSIATRIKVLRLTRKTSMRRWTVQEDDYLLRYYGVKSLLQISAKLQRSVQALESRLSRLEVYGAKSHVGHITVCELAACLEVDVHTIYKWIHKKNLPYKIIIAKTRKFMGIDIQSFWKWAEQNKTCLNFFKIPKNTLIPEPAWVDEQRKLDYVKRPKYEHKKWTAEEDARLWRMFYQEKRNQREIGQLLGRSRNSVQRRLERLRKKKLAS